MTSPPPQTTQLRIERLVREFPALVSELQLGSVLERVAHLAAELIGAPSGLGYAIEWYRELLMTPQVMSFIAMIGVLGYLCDRAVRELSIALTPWAPETAASK